MNQGNKVVLRWATPEHYTALGEVMFDAVRNGASLYSEDQRKAWVAAPRNDEKWHDRLGAQRIILAIHGEDVVGFMSLADEGYVDLAYIRPSFQNSGLFRKLYNRIEQLALDEKIQRLWVHASLKAQPAFSAMGFQITKEEQVAIGREKLRRFEMEKTLDH